MFKLVSVAIIFFYFFNICKNNSNNPICRDTGFEDDTILPRYTDYKFNPDNLPKRGVSTKSDLAFLDKRGPSDKQTFKKSFIKEIDGKKIEVDEIWGYIGHIGKQIKGENIIYGYEPLEDLSLFIFFNKGIVQDYAVMHNVKQNKGKTWKEGKYNSVKLKKEDGIYPGAIEDAKRYWKQRSIGDRMRMGNILSKEDYELYKKFCK